jgi:hypothetical protein
MTIEIFRDIEQNSDEWKRLRAGIPTASEFKELLAKGEGKSRRSLMRRLAGERVTGEAEATFENAATQRGHLLEDDARRTYALVADLPAPLEQVAFVKNFGSGCSPDSLIGDVGGLEIKTAKPSVLIDIFERDQVPTEHIAQVQGSMWITERAWWDVCIFWPKMPTFVRRVQRDTAYIANLAREVAEFNRELDALVERVRKWG